MTAACRFIFEREQREYADEGLAWTFVDFPSNAVYNEREYKDMTQMCVTNRATAPLLFFRVCVCVCVCVCACVRAF